MGKNKVWWVFGGLTLLIGVAFGYVIFNSKNQPASVEVPVQSTSQTAEPSQPSEALVEETGSYQPYSQQAFDDSQAQYKLLFFHAPWCPQCRAIEKSTSGGIPADVAIFKVDYDTATALRQKYGVTIQTTVVLVGNDGNLIKKHVAYDNPSLQAVLSALGIE